MRNPLMMDVINEYGLKCYWCHRQCIVDGLDHETGQLHLLTATIEHVIPVSLGGTNDIGNLRCACRVCNVMRDTTPERKWRKSFKSKLVHHIVTDKDIRVFNRAIKLDNVNWKTGLNGDGSAHCVDPATWIGEVSASDECRLHLTKLFVINKQSKITRLRKWTRTIINWCIKEKST